ncbi:MAG: carboxylating nicotinate-nucleotide diphosphorylase [Pseudomonadales bacterium]|nr:carboxylating nicotinate-nucleotide diphosphorylase [Pseudomonadales bacterium]MDP6470898.1 carboxylating nicotinate-nucleotide diphosphorylase [Pseudomonadales bacterium]MDP6825917.1 carboxylating nicotinate-nucleotide diphosphorylase [Pseudomonadales bacterium]
MTDDPAALEEAIRANVRAAIEEDIGSGDISAALIAQETGARATIITREAGVFCGRAWGDEVCRQVDRSIEVAWQVDDGDRVGREQVLVVLEGPARSLLSAERTLLNFLQFLSGTATATATMVNRIADTNTRLLDTRKTVPGLRIAQKYAVLCGGGHNHRIGLYDAYLIKENHIAAAGSISAAVHRARQLNPGKPVEVEVENRRELAEAITAGADIAMLDNFSLEETSLAVNQAQGVIALEASGGIDENSVTEIATTGVNYVSIGNLTKCVQPMDLSMRLD